MHMAASVTLLCGPARTGKTGQLLARYRQQLATGQPGSALWIAPTQRSTRDIRERLLDASLPACFSPGVSTFDGFAELVLAAAPQEIRPISSQIRRRIIARLLQRAAAAGELSYFAPIAETDGLVDLVTGWISELKRLEVWPEHFAAACKKRGTAAKDKELVALYQAYQEVLARHQLYDHEGRFWTARELLQSGQWGPLDHLQLVVVDGFTDFTRTQHEILELLARQAKEIWITLPLEPDSKRPDLFAKTFKTRDELQRRFSKASIQEVPRRKKSDWPTLDHIERQLFSSPQDAMPLKKSDRVEILAASRRLGEIEQVGRRVKELLVEEQVKPGDIAVVFRSLNESAPMVREVFRELGVPFYLDTEQTLLASPALKALASMVSLHVDDWPFRSLLALLSNNYFAPKWKAFSGGEGAEAAELLVRSLQVPSEREALLRQARSRFEHYRNLAGLPELSADAANEELSAAELAAFDSANNAFQEVDSDDEYSLEEETYSAMESSESSASAEESVTGETSPGAAHRASETHAGLALLERLAEAFDELPRKASLVEWGQALRHLAEALGLLRVVASDPPDGSGTGIDTAAVAEIDRQACEQLFAVLAGGDRLSDWLGEKPPELDASEFHTELVDLLQTEPLPRQRNETGCVRILAAGSARTLEIPYLFLAGLTERSFPQPDHDGLYTETEARTLISAGVPLVDRVERNQEELLLFYEIVTRPTKRLILSYPALDEKAQPHSPSSYLL
jgi:ATP-dependent helicase/nuclease subunit B